MAISCQKSKSGHRHPRSISLLSCMTFYIQARSAVSSQNPGLGTTGTPRSDSQLSSCVPLSALLETAKANGLEPYRYLKHVFERVPRAKSKEEYRVLLPQHMPEDLLAQLSSGGGL